MNRKKSPASKKSSRTVRGKGKPGAPSPPSSVKDVPAAAQSKAPAPADQSHPAEGPAPGLDDARHAAAQRTAHQAEVLRSGVFPALMASALSIDSFFGTGAYKLYLEQLLADSGNPTDPIERMMIEQLCMAHFRIAQLHGGAAHAKSLDAIKTYNTVTARLWGEFRRTALALRAYQSGLPKDRTASKLKLFKAAQ